MNYLENFCAYCKIICGPGKIIHGCFCNILVSLGPIFMFQGNLIEDLNGDISILV